MFKEQEAAWKRRTKKHHHVPRIPSNDGQVISSEGIAGLLGASPGASTAVQVALDAAGTDEGWMKSCNKKLLGTSATLVVTGVMRESRPKNQVHRY